MGIGGYVVDRHPILGPIEEVGVEAPRVDKLVWFVEMV